MAFKVLLLTMVCGNWLHLVSCSPCTDDSDSTLKNGLKRLFKNVWLTPLEYLSVSGLNQCNKPNKVQTRSPINDVSACQWTYEPTVLDDNTYPNIIFNAKLKTCPHIYHNNCIDLSHENEIKPLLNSECKPIMGNTYVLVRTCDPVIGKYVFKPVMKSIVTGYGCVYRNIDTAGGYTLMGKRQKKLEEKYVWLRRLIK